MSEASDPEQTRRRRDSDPDRKGPSAWDSALRLLGVRARSRQEMRDRLTRKGFEPEVVDEVMARLEQHKLLDDEEFASEWVRSRHLNSGKGRVALRHELRTKGVDESVISEALADIDPDDERDIASGLVARKLTPSVVDRIGDDRAERDKAMRRLVGMLVRRGYSQSLAFEVVGEALSALRSG
ncbi:RecX family transcriptional regulator [Gordonia terrae]|uniref:Regulatory protein RecX n=1 Tax=Gordonia terrae TaxID=2055 RepID=A0A2I1RE11_9ACTN|nr:regulatory protein RecX [Gordonia terrae]PKZ67306.1 RecX family transcriptional regulator [Gordonia terrae]